MELFFGNVDEVPITLWGRRFLLECIGENQHMMGIDFLIDRRRLIFDASVVDPFYLDVYENFCENSGISGIKHWNLIPF